MFLWWIVSLVLHFDGSLRPPRDSGFPTHGLGRMASCGAALYGDDHTLLTLGGKSLDIVPGITSADVEYDGLLFGLNHYLDERKDDDITLSVRGDCKAIIDQLNGNAVPRKLQPKHETALNLLERIEKVAFEHVPREENKLCDAICAGVTTIMEQRQVAAFRQELSYLTQSANGSSAKGVTTSELTNLLNRFLTYDRSLVCYSIRPRLYNEAVMVAELFKDGMALEYIGRHLVSEGKVWTTDGRISRELMTAQGILWQVQGLELMGNEKQTKRLLQKHRYLLNRFATHDTIIESFQASCDLLDDAVSFSPLSSDCDGNERDAFQSWYDEACQQDNDILQQGYWITT